MTGTMMRVSTAVVALFSLGLAAHAHGVDLPSSCNPQADAAVDEGLTLMHNMMYIQAEGVFNQAAAAEPECAMAQWGIAMANFHPLWPGGPTPEETARGLAAAEKLANLTAGNDLERGLKEAVLAFYAPDHDGYRARIFAWAAAQNDAYEANPDNIDAAALAALAMLASAPRGEEGVAVNAATGDLLDRLHEKAPHHPGVIHYAIHAYDNPPLKDRGAPYAVKYDKSAPNAAHALHMPSHIFTRTGDWAASIDLNRRSAEAALESSGDVIQTHYVHAIDYMVYGLLQLGEAEQAQVLVDDMLAEDNHQVSFGGAYALAASPVRMFMEQEKWAQAAALSPELHSAIPWENFPQTEAMLWFAKGIGAARSSDLEGARAAAEELGTLHEAMVARDQGYWAKLTEGQILSVEAWIEFGHGNDELALTMQAKAADLEDAIGKSPVTPGHILPARELLGDLYREMGEPEKAAEAYRRTLELSPNRARSLAALK